MDTSIDESDWNQEELKKWITCIALVTFDIDEGQKVECIQPKEKLSEQTCKELAMLSFPDSNSFNDYENSFKFTFRLYNGLFGYACFKQKKDPKNPRGFSQKSLVIVTHLPCVHIFEKLCEFIVFKTFMTVSDEEFPNTILNICKQISLWPDPTPKATYTLPIMTYEMQIDIPNYLYQRPRSYSSLTRTIEEEKLTEELKQNNKEFNLKNILGQELLTREGPFQEIKINEIFRNCHEALWAIWEGIMLNKSILIIGSNPQEVSHAVLGVVSLAYPFEYCGNFNPYVTIYDPNLDKLTSEATNMVIGGTNPLFEKLFNKEIIQIISLDKTYKCSKNLKPLTELLIKPVSEEQQAINESSIRKYFYQLNKSIMTILDTYLNQQTNNLKFFNDALFLKNLKEKNDYFGLQNVFSSKKYLLEFFQLFVKSKNFEQFLKYKNTIRNNK